MIWQAEGANSARGILRVDPELDGVPSRGEAGFSGEGTVPAATAQRMSRRDQQLGPDQVDAEALSSVTGCSTWSLVLTSRKDSSPAGASRNSTVPAPT